MANPATSAQLNKPQGVFLDTSGNIFIADTEDNRIRVVNTGTATIMVASISIPSLAIATVAGNGTAGYSGDTGAAISAELSSPYGVFVDGAENIFIADTGNNVIREVSSSGTITTVVGNGTECTPASATCGDGGAATSAQLSSPTGVFLDAAEDIFIADTFDNRIREVSASTSTINTVAGTGARGYSPDGSAATSAALDTPYGVFVDAAGDIFIADTDNFVIREVFASTGNIQTVAGNNTQGFSGDGGQSTLAELNSPTGLFGNAAGNLFVADTDNARIRQLVPAIFVTISPNPISVVVGLQQQFTAAVAGTSNTAVTWSVNGTLGGNSTVGTISDDGTLSGACGHTHPSHSHGHRSFRSGWQHHGVRHSNDRQCAECGPARASDDFSWRYGDLFTSTECKHGRCRPAALAFLLSSVTTPGCYLQLFAFHDNSGASGRTVLTDHRRSHGIGSPGEAKRGGAAPLSRLLPTRRSLACRCRTSK